MVTESKIDSIFLRCIDRIKQDMLYHGPIDVIYKKIARSWSDTLGFDVKPYQVAMCLAQSEILRASHKFESLRMIDAINLIAIAIELEAGPDAKSHVEIKKDV